MSKKLSIVLKLALSCALITGVILSFPLPSYSQSVSEGTKELLDEGFIDLNNLDKLDGNITVRDVSYDSAIASIAKLQGISIEEAKRIHPDKTSQGLHKGLRNLTSDVWIKEISIEQQVTFLYKPTLKIYAYYYSSGSFRQFQEIISLQLDRSSFIGTKQFSGNLEAEIPTNNPTQMWWLINGDFYDNGTTTISGSITAGGLIWKGTGTVQYASNHFEY
ncbi:hypothetical protein ABEX25_22760 [Paenibacillus thiaminolyticus]|uniref:hypothetical protein n=1 Tax=Paenibacillus thiaminolyticus TaxID=49283 RepID=UPI003D29A91E